MLQADAYSTTLPATVDVAGDTSTFFFGDVALRVVDRGGEPWFVALDVAKAVGHRDANAMTRLLRETEKGTHQVRTPGGVQGLTVITEAGLYRSMLLRQTGGVRLAPAPARGSSGSRIGSPARSCPPSAGPGPTRRRPPRRSRPSPACWSSSRTPRTLSP